MQYLRVSSDHTGSMVQGPPRPDRDCWDRKVIGQVTHETPTFWGLVSDDRRVVDVSSNLSIVKRSYPFLLRRQRM